MTRMPASAESKPAKVQAGSVSLKDQLSEHFGFRSFRPGQAKTIRATLQGRDTLAVMPTGSGKSLCYLMPALKLQGMTIVVSPLIALMRDQVYHAGEHGVSAALLNSSLSDAQQGQVLAEVVEGRHRILYVTPERLTETNTVELLRTANIDLFVVDEAHCISQWGHSFRSDYLGLRQAIAILDRPPVLALTATATSNVIEEILDLLDIPEADVVHTGFYRPNLRLGVNPAIGHRAKCDQLDQLLRSHRSGTGIIYASTIKAVEQIGQYLKSKGYDPGTYHGRLSAKRREQQHRRFSEGQLDVMVATNAFGLGIDQADIRYVIHYHIPAGFEAYYQEVGRAGRDGESSACVLLYDPADRKRLRFQSPKSVPSGEDLLSAYHAMSRLHDDQTAITLDNLKPISPISMTKIKNCLGLFEKRRIIEREDPKIYRLRIHDFTSRDLESLSNSLRLQRMQEEDRFLLLERYCELEHGQCRWRSMLSYFDSEELDHDCCGHCDLCC